MVCLEANHATNERRLSSDGRAYARRSDELLKEKMSNQHKRNLESFDES